MARKKYLRESLVPTRKVGSGVFAGAIGVVTFWLVRYIDPTIVIPAEVQTSATLIFAYAISYFVPDAE